MRWGLLLGCLLFSIESVAAQGCGNTGTLKVGYIGGTTSFAGASVSGKNSSTTVDHFELNVPYTFSLTQGDAPPGLTP